MQVKTGNTGLFNIVAVNSSAAGTITDRILISQDAFNWTLIPSTDYGDPGNIDLFDVAFSSTVGRFVIVTNSRTVVYSDDGGTTWAVQSNALPASGTSNWERIYWDDEFDKFFAANGDNTSGKLASSSDGLTWDLITPSGATATTTNYMKFERINSSNPDIGNRLLAYLHASSDMYIAHTTDGVNWKWQATHSGFDPSYGFNAPVAWSPVLEEIMYVESSSSSFTTPTLRFYDTATGGSPIFATADWTSSGTSIPPWARNGDYQSVEWISVGSPQGWLVTGKGDSSTFSDNFGSPFTGSTNFLSSKDSVNWNRIGGIPPIADAGPGVNGADQPYEWNQTIYVPSLDRIVAIASDRDTSAGSPSYYVFRVSNPINGKGTNWTKSSSWRTASVPTFAFSEGFHAWSFMAYGEATADGVTVNADSISVDVANVSHDSLAGFATSEHIDHDNVILTGDGMLEVSLVPVQIGSLAASRTLHVNQGNNIVVGTNTVAVGSSVVRMSGDTFTGTKSFLTPKSVQVGDGSAALPSLAFSSIGGRDTGMYRSGTYDFAFSTGGTVKFHINEANGFTLRSNNTSYETLVTDDDDIPNKQYVDNVSGGSGSAAVTENVFASRSILSGNNTTNVLTNRSNPLSISGLTSGKKYLVSVWGLTRNNGTGTGTLGQVRITSVHASPPNSGVLYSGPTLNSINWPDGHWPQHSMAVITAPAGGTIYGYVDYRTGGGVPTEWMSALYMTAVQLN
jgi:hypothetical protein